MQSIVPWRLVLLAGVAGEIAFEFYAWVISPMLFGPSLAPANLVMALSNIYLGLQLSYPVAFALHALLGSIGFALLVFTVQRVLKCRWLIAGAVTGFGLWFVAQGLLAPAVGRSFMMDFGAYTQSSFIAHTMMTMVIATVFAKGMVFSKPALSPSASQA